MYSRRQHVVQQSVSLLFLQGQFLSPLRHQLFKVVTVRLQHLYHVVHNVDLSVKKKIQFPVILDQESKMVETPLDVCIYIGHYLDCTSKPFHS